MAIFYRLLSSKFVNNVSLVFWDLLLAAGAEVKVVRLPGPEKGADDFIYAKGREAYETVLKNSKSLSEWKKVINMEKGDYKYLTSVPSCKV